MIDVQEMSEGDLEELAKEARLLKKFKAGKVVVVVLYLWVAYESTFPITVQITKEQLEASLDGTTD